MAITVTQRPSTTISGETSKWNAVNNPVIYKMTTNQFAQPNYRLEVEVYNAANTLLTVSPLQFIPDSTGAFIIDISSVLRNNLVADFAGVLTGTTEVFDDSNVYIKFYIKYHEKWDASAQSQTNDSANQFFAVLSAMQIPALYGGNMANYVTFDDGTPAAKFLTKLDTIKMWRGYPCLVSVIVGDGITGNQIFSTDSDSTTPADYSDKIIVADLDQIINDQDIISTDLELYRDASPDVLLTESKRIELLDACENPVFLTARNKYGGFIQWMFDVDQDYTFDYGNNIKAKRQVLKAQNLTINEWEALQDFISLGDTYRNNIVELTSSVIKTSSRIGNQVYVIDSTGNKTGVLVIPTNNSTRTRQIKHYFEIEIEYPEEL
jgi:hypothetical protein